MVRGSEIISSLQRTRAWLLASAIVVLFGGTVLAPTSASAQARASMWVDVRQESGPGEPNAYLGPTVRGLFLMELGNVPWLDLRQGAVPDHCGGQEQSPIYATVDRYPAQKRGSALPGRPIPDPARARGRYFVLRAAVETLGAQSALRYALEGCNNGTLEVVLPIDVVPITGDYAIGGLVSLVEYVRYAIEDLAERPSVFVADLDFEAGAGRRAVADATAEWIRGRLWETGDVDVIEGNGGADYVISGSLSFTNDRKFLLFRGDWNRVTAQLQANSSGGQAGDARSVTGTPESLLDFYSDVADRAVDSFRELQDTETFLPDNVGGSATLDELVRAAERALCLPDLSPCLADPGAAIRILDTALELDSANSTAWRLRGVAVESSGDLAASAVDFRRVVEILGERAPVPTDSLVAALNDLARVYLSAGQYQLAEAELDESLRIEPDQPLALAQLSAAIRLSGRATDALAVVFDALTTSPGESALVRAGATLLRALDAHQMLDLLDRVVLLCQSEPSLEVACASSLLASVEHQYSLHSDAPALDQLLPIRQLALAIVQVTDEPNSVGSASAYLAETFLGAEDILVGISGAYVPFYADSQPDSVEKYLSMVDGINTDRIDLGTQEWLLRLRALSALHRGEPLSAVAWADSALALDRQSGPAKTIGAQALWSHAVNLREQAALRGEEDPLSVGSVRAAYQMARVRTGESTAEGNSRGYWYHREVMNALGARPKLRLDFESVLESEPGDVQALDFLASVCADLVDSACEASARSRLIEVGVGIGDSAYVEGLQNVRSGTAVSVLQRLILGEAAIMGGLLADARLPLEPSLDSSAPPCYRVLQSVLMTWIELREDHEAAARNWRAAFVDAYEEYTADRVVCWDFIELRDVHRRLRFPSTAQRDYVGRLMALMEEPGGRVPPFPS